jgi:integrase
MPVLDKKRKTWTGRVTLKGYPVKTKRGFPTKTAAKEWERLSKAELKDPVNLVYSFSQAADIWLVACQKRNKPDTCNNKAVIVNAIMEYWRSDPLLPDVTTLDIESYLNSLTGKTANRHLREMNTFFLYAVKRGMAPGNPVGVIERFKEKPFMRYVPPQEHIQKAMDIAGPLERTILLFAYHTLARAGEIRGALWEDVDFDKQTITLWTSKTRTGNRESDTLDMTDTLFNLLKELHKKSTSEYIFTLDGKPLEKWWLNLVLKKICIEAKIKHFSLHCIRHHVAALLAYKLSLIEISKILRHKNLTTTDIYLRSIVKIETKGIKVLDDLGKSYSGNVIPFARAATSK